MTRRSKNKLSQEQMALLYVAAGGRCEFPGCNEPIDYHSITKEPTKHFELAHNIAASADGPRGHKTLSQDLASDPGNILVLCRNHHKPIDDTKRGHLYSVDQLKRFKERHEERISRLLSIDPTRETIVIDIRSKIDLQISGFDNSELNSAVLSCSDYTRYPATLNPIRIGLSDLPGLDGEGPHHCVASAVICQSIENRLLDCNVVDKPISLFAIAPMVDLMTVGRALGNKRTVYLYQRDRVRETWEWSDPSGNIDPGFSYSLPNKLEESIGIIIELSGRIPTNIQNAALGGRPIATITVPDPTPLLIRRPEDIEEFRMCWLEFLAELRSYRGIVKELHIVLAAPAPLCVEMGRQILPKVDPRVFVYDVNRRFETGISKPIELR